MTININTMKCLILMIMTINENINNDVMININVIYSINVSNNEIQY